MKRRALQFERLESRCLLAGDVFVSVKAGDLIIKGDNDDNEVVVRQVGDGEYEICGCDGTTIHFEGDTYSKVTVTGVLDDILVDLKNGDNAFVLYDAFVPDDFIYKGGKHSDIVVLGLVDVNDSAVMDTGKGDDAVLVGVAISSEFLEFLANLSFNAPECLTDYLAAVESNGGEYVEIGGSLTIKTGDGEDAVLVGVTSGYAPPIAELTTLVEVGGDLIIDTGNHDDAALVGVYFDLGGANDYDGEIAQAAVLVGDDLIVDGGNGENFVGIGIVIPAAVSLAAENGPEIQTLNGSGYGYGSDLRAFVGVEDDLVVKTGKHDDAVFIGTENFDAVTNNSVLETHVMAHDLIIHLGNGNNVLHIAYTWIVDDTIIHGGSNFDEVRIMDSTFGDVLKIATGHGMDFVGLFNIFAFFAHVNLGHHDDALIVDTAAFGKKGFFDGSHGFDTCFIANITGDEMGVNFEATK
jgi:hypothetical protein